jgi:hypothetical protein
MDFTGDYFAVAETRGTDGEVPVHIYRGTAGLTAVQLGEALDNPELLEGNWQLVQTVPAASAAPDDIAGSLAADSTIRCGQGDSVEVGRWRILPLQDVRLEPGPQVR